MTEVQWRLTFTHFVPAIISSHESLPPRSGPAHAHHGLHQHTVGQVSRPDAVRSGVGMRGGLRYSPTCGTYSGHVTFRWADTMTSESTDGVRRGFDHPFLQACGMFLGEMMCMVAFLLLRWHRRRQRYVRGSSSDEAEQDSMDQDAITRPRNFSPLIFWPPALCDMTATSIQYIGLTLTYASSFQMLRGVSSFPAPPPIGQC